MSCRPPVDRSEVTDVSGSCQVAPCPEPDLQDLAVHLGRAYCGGQPCGVSIARSHGRGKIGTGVSSMNPLVVFFVVSFVGEDLRVVLLDWDG